MIKSVRLTLIVAACLSSPFLVAAQQISQPATSVPNAVGEFHSVLSRKAWELNAVKAKDLESVKPKMIGTLFLSDDWVTGTLYITSNRILEDQLFKYDIENNLFLLRGEDEAQPGESIPYTVINGAIVLGFEEKNAATGPKRYLNATNAGFKQNGQAAPGFVEVLVDGDMSLYLQTTATVLKANYNAALNIGEREDRVVKQKLYFVKRKGDDELMLLNKNKKYSLAPFGDREAEVSQYIKKNKLRLSNEEELKQVVVYYNSL